MPTLKVKLVDCAILFAYILFGQSDSLNFEIKFRVFETNLIHSIRVDQSDFECPHYIISEFVLIHQCYLELFTNNLRLIAVGGPVLCAHHPNELIHFGQHHYHTDILLPDHTPEIFKGRLVRSLRNNIRIWLQ